MGLLEKQSVKSNFIFQAAYQLLIYLIPLIVSPYLTRTLGDTSLGIYTYVNSIAYYFAVFANLGIAKYGQRKIAECKDDLIALRKNFWSIYCNHLVTSGISLIAYIVVLAFFVNEYKVVYLVHIIYILSVAFDITWLFFGLENFKSVTIRNTVVKILETAAIFAFIKSQEDLWKYTMIICLGALIGQIIIIPQAIMQIKPIKIGFEDVFSHTGPLVYFSMAVLAITLYTIFDKTLLGILVSKEDVAYYEYANKIITIPKAFISVIATTLFPKACYLASAGKHEDAQKYIKISVTLTSMFAFASIFGIIGIAKEFSVIYYGEEFAKTGFVMMCMAPLIYILTLGDTIRLQYMIPNHKDKAYLLCCFCNAGINLILSPIFILRVGVYGAVIGTIAAELFGVVFQIIYSRKAISIKMILKEGIPFAVIGFIMYVVIYAMNTYMSSGIINLLVKILVGALVYGILAAIYLFFISSDKMNYRNLIFKLKK